MLYFILPSGFAKDFNNLACNWCDKLENYMKELNEIIMEE